MSSCTERPTPTSLQPILRELYERAFAGGCWHIVFDDGNIEKEHVDFCMDHHGDSVHEGRCRSPVQCEILSTFLPKMSQEDLAQLYQFCHENL